LEFDALERIRQRFGPRGIRDFVPGPPRCGAITDDTQMTLFTAEGLVLAARAGALQRPSELVRIVHRAYLRWLRTQGERSKHPSYERSTEGWLLGVPELHAQRAPGATCLAALRGERMGRLEHPLNTSKGCGGVMRVAPAGLARAVDDPFRLGCRLAALTHGHPTGHLAGGFLALAIRELVGGASFKAACAEALEELHRWPGSEECEAAVENALASAAKGSATPECVESLGQGWVAEEALAIAVYCTRVAPDFETGVCLAVNHGGDSDSTGAIAGNLLGAALGADAIPCRWLENLELREEIEHVAQELWSTFS
jgi:ADP-ribosylglycohydrolase